MTSPFVRRGGILVVLACVAAACGGSTPASPSGISQPQPAVPAAPGRTPVAFPPLSGPSRTYVFDHELRYKVSDYTKQSRVVLFDNGALALQYPTIPNGSLSGQYRAADGVLTMVFEFDGRTAYEGAIDATGTLQGSSLTVEFGEAMQLADYENAVYVLSATSARRAADPADVTSATVRASGLTSS